MVAELFGPNLTFPLYTAINIDLLSTTMQGRIQMSALPCNWVGPKAYVGLNSFWNFSVRTFLDHVCVLIRSTRTHMYIRILRRQNLSGAH